MRQDQPMAYPDYGSITIRGARENNLKNVSLWILEISSHGNVALSKLIA